MSAPKTPRSAILVLRGHEVLLDAELAALYGVDTRVLLQAVKRNRERFPEDFMIQLTAAEWAALRSQIVTLKRGRGQHRKYRPTRSPSRAWPCSRRCSRALAPSP
jgi:hypothetical protein